MTANSATPDIPVHDDSTPIPLVAFPPARLAGSHAERVLAHVSRAIRQQEATAAALKQIVGRETPLVLNFSRSAYRGLKKDGSGHIRMEQIRSDQIEMFAAGLERYGRVIGHALDAARDDAEDPDQAGQTRTDYIATVILRPDGTWGAVELFPGSGR